MLATVAYTAGEEQTYHWICWVRPAVGLLWQRVDEALLTDDPMTSAEDFAQARYQLRSISPRSE